MQSPPIAFASMFSKYHVIMNISKYFVYKINKENVKELHIINNLIKQ